MRHLGVAGRIYHAGVILLGVAIVPVGLLVHPLTGATLGELAFLAAATQVAALMPIRWSNGTHTVATAPLLATGLLVPGGGVALVAWLFVFDGRVPGRDIRPWQALFNRANLALTHAASSLLVLALPVSGVSALPVRTIVYAIAIVAINYSLTAVGFSFYTKTGVATIWANNVRLTTFQAMLILGFAGGTLYLLLQKPVGYLMAPGLLGVLIVVRSNVAHAQRQVQARQQTLRLAAQALDARDRYTESHSERVADLAGQIGQAMGLTSREIEELRTAGSLHDLGKIGIPDRILNKASALSPSEWMVMKTHSDIGADMISQHSALEPVAPLVRHHHERWDGSGYPRGLAHETIPLGARILAVADSFDTMTSPRLYRQTFLTHPAAVTEISALAGKWYDPGVVDALRDLKGLPPLTQRQIRTTGRPWPAGLGLLRERPRFTQLALGMSISSLGDPLTTVATLVSIYAFTHQPLWLAAVYIVKAMATIAMGAVGGVIPDRVERKRLILALELVRGAVLVLTPLALIVSLYAIFPIIFVLAAVNAVVQPTRQAVIPELVPPDRIGAGTAMVATSTMVATALGFPLAAILLWLSRGSASWLFEIDGATFALAGLLILGVGNVGGAAGPRLLGNGFRETWKLRTARAQLTVAAAGAFFISMSFPTLLVLAWRLAPNGAEAYTFLEAALAVGVIAGSLLIGQLGSIGSLKTVLRGLGVMGAFTIAIGFSHWLPLTAILLVGASVGNAIYGVANQTALLQLGDTKNRGRIMAARFGIAQIALIAGAVTGGATTSAWGPGVTYGIIGSGLIVIALAAGMAMRLARPQAVDAALDPPGRTVGLSNDDEVPAGAA